MRDQSWFFDAAARAAKLGTWEMHSAASPIVVSSETSKMFGLEEGYSLPREEMLSLLAGDHRRSMANTIDRCFSDGAAFDELLLLVTRQGEVKWIRSIGEAQLDDDGKVDKVRGLVQDVTDLFEARSAARQLHEQIVETVERISDGFMLVNEDGRISFANSMAERLAGTEPGQLIGQNVLDAFPDAQGSRFEQAYLTAADGGEAILSGELCPLRGLWFDMRAFPTSAGVAIYFQEVSARVQRDEHLRLLENAVSHQGDILLITDAASLDDPDGPKIVYANEAFERVTGFSPEEVIGKTPRILQGPKSQRDALDVIRAALEAKAPVRAELINYTKSGEQFWVEMDIVPVGDGGRITHFVAVERDVTERRRTTEEIRLNEERFRLLAQATSDAVWDWDIVRGLIWWSEGLRTHFGHDPEAAALDPDFWGKNLADSERAEVADRLLEVVLEGGTTWRSEHGFRRADGSFAQVIDRGFVIRDTDGRAIRMVGSTLDATERNKLEEQLRQSQKLEAIGQLTGGVAHDFNNLLTVILGNSEILTESLPEDGELHGLARMTVLAAERGAELTNRLLAFARRQPLEPALLDVGQIVNDMYPLLQRTLGEQIEIELDPSDRLWSTLADKSQLELAILNLGINARDAMPDGGKLIIETRNASLDGAYARSHSDVIRGEYVMVSVSDTGVGMSRDVMNRAFEPFFTTKGAGVGSGLGLSMVYGFVKQSGGHVELYSELGQGTSIKLYFPRVVAEGAQEPTPTPNDVVGGSEHILLVEDDSLVIEYVRSQLQTLGYRVTVASSGAEALEAVEQDDGIDLLFTDIVMPGGINGRELAEKVALLRPAMRVLFTSGYSENAVIHHGRLDRGVALLSKPYSRHTLAQRVREVLDRPKTDIS